jgi:acyl-CoA dehydrogenase
VITGQKALVVNAGIADFFVVFAATPEPGDLSAFVVEADRAGVVVRAPEEMLGARGIPTADVELVGVRVPADQLLGVAGEGRELAEAAMSRGHLGIAAQAVGIAQAAGDYATAYAHDRRQFGRPIESFEGIQLKIGGMAIRCAAARELLYQACAMVDRGDAAAKRYASMAKAFCTDTALLVTGEAVQVLGGYGFIRDYPVERHLRDAKVAQIRLGGNDGRRMAVARSLR